MHRAAPQPSSPLLVLLLDDDARVIDASSIQRAMEIMDADDLVGAVAFAQAEADGQPWPVAMQPSRAARPSVIPSFIGFAHLLRRDLFLRLGLIVGSDAARLRQHL